MTYQEPELLPFELIRKRRRALGLTQDEAADLADISREMWNGIENGKRGVGAKTAARLVTVLGGSPNDYLSHPLAPWIERFEQRFDQLEDRIKKLEG